MEITKELVQEFLNKEENKEIAKEITSSFFTSENVKEFLETDKGKELLQPKLDSHFSRSLKTWKENNLDRLISEEVARLNPAETEEQKALREANLKIAQMEAESKRKDLINLAQTKGNELGLSSFMALRCVGDDEATTLELLEEASKDFSNSLSNAVKKQLENTDTTPKFKHKTDGNVSKQDFLKMSYRERSQLFLDNPDLYNQLSI